MLRSTLLFVVAAVYSASIFAQSPPQTPASPTGVDVQRQTYPADVALHGGELFQQNCAFCHGRDAAGGETGPDLTRSKLVADDKNGDLIGPVIHNGRTDKGMPAFALPDPDVTAVVAFIHNQKTKSETQKGGRRGVDVSDLQTGNADAGKQYFEGAGKCSTCHSASGDLAGVATRFKGLQLEQRMLFPRNVLAKVTVRLASGQTVTGTLAYRDEFTIGVKDESGKYRSWAAKSVQYTVDDPVQAHADQLAKYSDDDIHNLMAYLQTLK